MSKIRTPYEMKNQAGKKQPREHRAIIPEAGIDVALKDRWLAAFLAWIIPGLGHFYQGRTAKGALFMICIWGTFLFGLYIGDGHVVYASKPMQQPYRWNYWCQAGAGLPAMPALVQRERAKSDRPALWGGLMAPPRSVQTTVDANGREQTDSFTSKDGAGNLVTHPNELAKWNHDMPSRFEMGTVFTMIAGLLNVLVIYDAFAGPMVLLHEPKKKGEAEPGDTKEE